MADYHSDSQKIAQHFLFWLHVLFLAIPFFLGLFVTPLAALFIIAAHRLHVLIFGECLLSKIQRRAGGLPKDINFLQHLAINLFGKEISHRGSQIIDYSLVGSMIAVALIK